MANPKTSPILLAQRIIFPFKIEALCSLYSQYEVCNPTITQDKISANFPTEFLELDAANLISIEYLEQKGDRDFLLKYRENGKHRTAMIRFRNDYSLEQFTNAIAPLKEVISKTK